MIRPAARARLFAAVFLVLAAPLGVVMATLIPPGLNPDETAHMLRVDALSRGQLVGYRAFEEGDSARVVAGVDADEAIAAIGLVLPVSPLTPMDAATFARIAATQWSGVIKFFQISPIAVFPPTFYAPQAAGLLAARAAGFAPYTSVVLARLAGLGAFLLIGAAALLLASGVEALLLAVLLLPMTLSLAASCSQDGLLIAAAVMAVALVVRGLAGADGAAPPGGIRGPIAYGLAALLIALVASAKPPYLPLAAILFLPFGKRLRSGPPSAWFRIVLVLIVCAVTAGYLGWSLHHVAVSRPFPPEEAGPLWPGPRPAPFAAADPAAQAAVLLADPFRIVRLAWEAATSTPWLWRSVLGLLGWLNVILPAWLYAAWTVAIGAAALAVAARHNAGGRGVPIMVALEATCLTAAIIASVLAIYASQYLTWTRVGTERIEGVQGRYFLPLLPVLALALPRLPLPGSPLIRATAIACVVAAGAFNVIALPRVIVLSFYLR